MKTALLNDPVLEVHTAEHYLAEISLLEAVTSHIFFHRSVVCYALVYLATLRKLFLRKNLRWTLSAAAYC